MDTACPVEAGIIGARIIVIAVQRRSTRDALTQDAGISSGTGVAIITREGVGDGLNAADRGLTGIDRALVAIITIQRIGA